VRLLFLLKARKAYYKDKSGRVFRWDAGRKRYIYVRKGRHAHIKPEEIKRRERIKKENIHDRLRYERRIRSKFVGRVADGPAYEAIDQPYEKIQIGRAHSTQLPKYQYVSKDLRGTLKDHQEDFINLAMQKFDEGQKGVMCGDGTGSGKSMQELALAETFMEHDPSARVIIVTESDRIISESLAKDGKTLGIGMTLVKKETDEVKDSGIYVTRYSDLAALKDKLAWSDLVIFDESHNMKNKMSSKTKAGIDLIGSSKHSAVFTATPIDRPMHIEYLCKMYGLDFSKVMKFVGFQRLQYGWNTNQSAVVIAERLDSIFQTLSEKGLFVRREVPLEGLDVTMKTVKMSASHKYWYESTVDKLREEVEKASDKDRGLTKARWLMRARAVLEEAKIKEALTSIDDAIKKGRQVVLFATRVNETTLSRVEAPSLR
jgi:superfamily II DNA or RNA helicase